ncbi:hypothetical protein BLOT_001464 [Blomia tropicalis]|nr:hypothetical protein BLOT_001464 [Blomia tropicalis]
MRPNLFYRLTTLFVNFIIFFNNSKRTSFLSRVITKLANNFDQFFLFFQIAFPSCCLFYNQIFLFTQRAKKILKLYDNLVDRKSMDE